MIKPLSNLSLIDAKYLRSIAILSVISLLVFMVFLETRTLRLCWDEVYYVAQIHLLKKMGLTIDFLKDTPGCVTGPLHALIQVAFDPLTKLQLIGMRIINTALLSFVVLGIYLALRATKCSDCFLKSLLLFSVPSLYPVSGMVLTDIPALAFSSVGFGLILQAIRNTGAKEWALLILSSLSFGISCFGRQLYLVNFIMASIIPILASKGMLKSVVFFLLGIMPIGLLIFLWGGLVPPSTTWINQAFRPFSIFEAFFYIGMYICFIDPSRFSISRGSFLLVLVGALLMQYAFPNLSMNLPASTLLGHSWLSFIPPALLSVKLIVISFTILLLLRMIFESRNDVMQMCVVVTILLIAISVTKISNSFHSKYLLGAVPYIIFLAKNRAERPLFIVIRIIFGGAIGLFLLHGYLR